jgi:alpha/beta superfamily hydrolase
MGDSERVLVPGRRGVRGTLDRPDSPESSADGVVVACPPHPQMGGDRRDRRLRAVSDALLDRGVACLRIDYGPWDEGRGERTDASNAFGWAREHEQYGRVGLFGYSFGAAVSLLVAASESDTPRELAAVSVLAPPAALGTTSASASAPAPVPDALADIACPVQVVYGERDDTVDWAPVVERARDRGAAVATMSADHHFVGQHDTVAGLVGGFLAGRLSRQ